MIVEPSTSSLHGLRVFVVEDEGLIAMLIEGMFEDLGCHVVANAANVAQGLEIAANETFDFALLDVNLNGDRVFPVAQALISRQVPIAFSTGYGASGIPHELAGRPVLTKPFRLDELAHVVAEATRKADD